MPNELKDAIAVLQEAGKYELAEWVELQYLRCIKARAELIGVYRVLDTLPEVFNVHSNDGDSQAPKA